MNTKARGTVAYCEIGLVRSNVWRTIRLAYCRDQVTTLSSRDALVELAEVLADLLVVRGRVRVATCRRLDDPPERRYVVFVRGGSDHADERGDLLFVESLDQSEVEEGDLAVAMEQVVAGVWVAVESVHPVQAAEHESEQALTDQVAFACGQSIISCQVAPADQFAGQHSSGGVRRPARRARG